MHEKKQQDKAKRNKQQGGWVGGTSLFRKVMTIDKEISESHEGGWGGVERDNERARMFAYMHIWSKTERINEGQLAIGDKRCCLHSQQ